MLIPEDTMKTLWPDRSLLPMTSLLVALTALLAGAVLWLVHEAQRETAHYDATRTVLAHGQRLVELMASNPAVTNADVTPQTWEWLSRVIDAAQSAESGVEYVTIARKGVVVFHRQTSALDTGVDAARAQAAPPGRTHLAQKRLMIGGLSVPVAVLSRQLASDGDPVVVEVAVRRDAVGRREACAATAIAAMFRVALATVAVAVLLCMTLLVWMIRRERKHQLRRRREEHLAFSGVLANGIAHDFRNPMSSLRLDAQMIEKEISRPDGSRSDRVAELASRIKGTLDRMDKVFQEFLYLSRPAGDRREVVDLRQVVRECMEVMAPRFEYARVTVSASLPDVPLPVPVYAASLKRALINIITNAEQFAGEGGTVTLAATGQGHTAQLDIADSGPGIPKEHRDRVFEMFYSTRPEGTGLGLFLARSAIERSGGTVEAVDAGTGACIRIVLPMQATGKESAT
jgi:signal transduction histidine kinase